MYEKRKKNNSHTNQSKERLKRFQNEHLTESKTREKIVGLCN